MILNCDLDKTLTIEQVQKVLEEVIPRDGETRVYTNPEGFGGHYYVDNVDILDTEYVMKMMVEEADRGN